MIHDIKLMSELALGQYGWAMFVAFLGLAAGFFLVAGIFPLGNASTIHIGAIALAFIFSVLSMYLFPANAELASKAAPRPVSWTLATGVAASVAMGNVIPIGVAQRLAASCLMVWLVILSWRLLRR